MYRYGRRPTLILSVFLISVFGVAKTFSTNYITFITLHFFGALFGGGAFGLVFVLGSEVVGPSSRGFGAGIISNAVSVAQMMLAVTAMYISDFRILLRFLFGLVAFVLTFIWLVPESVRWLFSVGKHEEGMKILEKAATMNGSKIPTDNLNDLTKHCKNLLLLEDKNEAKKKIEQNPMVTALKSKVLLVRLINCCYCYFTNALIYFGLSVYSSILPGDKHMNLLYAGIVELPGNAATPYVVKRYGRKWGLIMSMLVCSVACAGSELLLNPSMKIIFFLIGKFAVALSYTILNMYSIELFPTNLRQSMFNTCMLFGGFGNMMAPQLPLLV